MHLLVRVSGPCHPLGDLPYPSQRKRRLFRLAIVSFAIGRCCSDPFKASCYGISPSVRSPPTSPPFSPPNPSSLPYSPCHLSPRAGAADRRSFQSRVSFVFHFGKGITALLATAALSPLIPRRGPGSATTVQGQGQEHTNRDEEPGREHGEPDPVACRKRARAGPCRSLGAWPSTNLGKATTLPQRAAPLPPMRQSRPLGAS